MIKKSFLSLITLLFAFSACACGVSSEDYSNALSARDTLKKDYDNLKSQYDTLKNEHDLINTKYNELTVSYNKLDTDYKELESNSTEWLKLSEDERATRLAQAEVDRIAAEEAEKKAKEEQEAARIAAEEEAARIAAEEAAAREAEEKKGYETGITYNDLARNPDDYTGKKVKFKGRVLQVSELSNEIQIRLATKKDSWGYSDDIVYLYFEKSLISSRILDDDIITIYGTAKGLHTYETVLGANVTLPLIYVEKIDIQ